MKFGLHFGSRGTAGEPDSLKAIAQKAEACGFTHFGMSDHVVVATEVGSSYPYSETGRFFAQDTGVSLETITALSFVASATDTIRLLSSVLVLPHRPPVLAARRARSSAETITETVCALGRDSHASPPL